MGDISIDDCVSLVVLVDHIESLAIPDAQVTSLPVNHVVAKDALQFVDFGLKVDHDFSGGWDFLKAHFFLFPEIFVQNLEEKLGNQCFDMLLVWMLSVNPLNVHLADIILIFVTEFVHAPD